nr:zinc finger, CCHC-type [Tanacetum cinerariifolium]
MRTRRSYFPTNVTIPRRQRKQNSNIVEPEIRTIVEMADNRTMAQMLQAPIEGYEDAIVVPPINANNFKLKQTLINLVQSNKFMGRQDPHNHLRFFNKVTSMFRHPEVPNTTIKLLLFTFSLEGEAQSWLDKQPPHSILTWEDCNYEVSGEYEQKARDQELKQRYFEDYYSDYQYAVSIKEDEAYPGFFEKQKLTVPNFIDWYRQLRIVVSIEDNLNYLEQPIPPAHVAPVGQQVAPEILTAHNAWIKGSKEIAGPMLMTMKPEIQ